MTKTTHKFCKYCKHYARLRIRSDEPGRFEWAQYGLCRATSTVRASVMVPCDGTCEMFEKGTRWINAQNLGQCSKQER